MHAVMKPALVPKTVTPACAARSHSALHARIARVAVVEHDRRLGEQDPDQEVPHHPAGRREPEHAIAGLRIDVQVLVLELLEQDPAVALHDRLGQPRRARRVQHPQGMVERDLLEGQLGVVAEELLEGDHALQRLLAQQHGGVQRRHLRHQPGHDLPAVEPPPAVAVATRRQQHLGLDLREPIHHAARPEVRRARRPHRPQRRRRQHARDRLHAVGQIGHDTITRPDPTGAQTRRDPRRQLAQLAPRHLAQRLVLTGGEDGDDRRVLAAKHVLGVVQARPREPPRPRHRLRGRAGQNPLVPHRRLHVEELPDRRPERLDVVDRPLPQLPIGQIALAQPAGETGQRGVLDALRRRLPEHRRGGCGHGPEP